MEHIEQPSLNPLPHLRIPYIVTDDTRYDGKGFLDFPGRCGFAEFVGPLDQEGPDFTIFPDCPNLSHTTVRNILSFLQSWVYFAFVIEFFALLDIAVHESDFVVVDLDGSKFISSRKLNALCRLWEVKSRDLDSEAEHHLYGKSIAYFRSVENIVAPLMIGLFLMAMPKYHTERLDHQSDAYLADSLLFSIQVLAETLQTCVKLLTPSEDKPNWVYGWGDQVFIRQRLMEAGWCQSQIEDIADQDAVCPTSCLYYLSMVNMNMRGQDHSACTRWWCAYETLDESTYQTKHTSNCEGCRFVTFEQSWNCRISSIVAHEGIPLVTVSGYVEKQGMPGKKPCITLSIAQQPREATTMQESPHLQNREVSAEFMVPESCEIPDEVTRQTYVCISHVWAE